MAWARTAAPGETGVDKPGDGDAGAAKPARFVITNPARDITIVTDRHELFVEFFRRQPVMIATLTQDQWTKLLAGKGTVDLEFVDRASFNVDGPRAAAYGASVKLAPFSATHPTDEPLRRVLELSSPSEPIIFVRDSLDKNLWHAVGYTRRPSAAFFTGKVRVAPDDFAPIDLLHTEKK
jgi:hypothetical protein